MANLIRGKYMAASTVTEREIAASALGDGLSGGGGTVASVNVSDIVGNGLEDDGGNNARINVSSATVTFTGGTWTFPVDVLQITGTPDSANDVVNKAYVDNQLTGISWKDPVKVTDFIGERSVTQIDALTPSEGWAVVSTSAGTPTAGTSDALATGDLAEFDGTSWKKVFDNAAGRLPNDVRLIVSTTAALFSPLTDATDDGKILVSVSDPGAIDGSVSDFNDTGDAVDGNAVLVQCPPGNSAASVNENNGYVFDGTVPTGSWIQFTGAGQLNAGAGISKTGNTLNIGDVNRGVQVNADDLELDASEVASSNGGLQQNSTNSWQLDIKTHAGALGAAVTTDANGININGDHVDITFNPSNYTPSTVPAEADDIDDLAAHLAGIDNALAALASDTSPTFQQDLTASVTAADEAQATATTVATTPAGNGAISVFVGGLRREVGNGTKTGVDCYFSGDGGTTARAFGAITSGDTMHWNGSVAGFELDATDRIDWEYPT